MFNTIFLYVYKTFYFYYITTKRQYLKHFGKSGFFMMRPHKILLVLCLPCEHQLFCAGGREIEKCGNQKKCHKKGQRTPKENGFHFRSCAESKESACRAVYSTGLQYDFFWFYKNCCQVSSFRPYLLLVLSRPLAFKE